MKKIIEKFIASIRQKLLVWRIHREIKCCIFPQLKEEKKCGYPFGNSQEELENLATFGQYDAQLHLKLIEKGVANMPDSYRDAFRYIMYRDLNARMKMYLEIARKFRPRQTPAVAPQAQPAT